MVTLKQNGRSLERKLPRRMQRSAKLIPNQSILGSWHSFLLIWKSQLIPTHPAKSLIPRKQLTHSCFFWAVSLLICDGTDLQDARTLLRISDGRHYILAILAADLKDKQFFGRFFNISQMDKLVKVEQRKFGSVRDSSTWTSSFFRFSN